MAFLDDLRKNFNALTKASEEVVKKSGGAVELRKLKMEQESLKGELQNCYAQIGRLVVEQMDGVDVPAEMEMLVRQIADCKEALAENERLIAKKRGIRLCPVCGAKADKSAVFCQKCGTRLPVEQEEGAETEEPETTAEAEPVSEPEEAETSVEPEEATEAKTSAKPEEAPEAEMAFEPEEAAEAEAAAKPPVEEKAAGEAE